MSDPLEQAVKSVEDKAQSVELVQVTLKLPPNGRPFVLALPKDATDFEIIAAMCQVAAFGDQLRAQRPSSRIVLPNGVARQT